MPLCTQLPAGGHPIIMPAKHLQAVREPFIQLAPFHLLGREAGLDAQHLDQYTDGH